MNIPPSDAPQASLNLRFRIAPEVFERFPDACVALVSAAGVLNDGTERGAAAHDVLRAAQSEVRERLTVADLKAHPSIARWREAFRALDLNPAKYRSSVEALLARVLKGDDLPALSPAVDLANAVSLGVGVPIGAHDAARLHGGLEVRVTRGGEFFEPVGDAPEVLGPGEIVYTDDERVRTRRWVWRQGEGARARPESTAIVFPIDGWRGLDDEAMRTAAETLARLLHEYTGARTALSFVSREEPEVTVFEDGVPVGNLEVGSAPASSSVDGAPAVHSGAHEPDAIDELLDRGVAQIIVRENLERRLRAGERLRVKLGIDPTGPRLHLGRAVPLRKLRRFQELGHTICLVIGDFTGQVGDVSGHTSARRHVTEDEIYQNMAGYKDQIGRILDPSAVEWSYNSDWLGQLRFKDVIGLSHLFTVQQMLKRDNFRQRYEAEQPIGLHEFFYPLMQGYDSYALEADLELGGTDQLFNLQAGRTVQAGMMRRPQDLMTMQMIWGLDGGKMSTSLGNTVLLDEPAVDMYGKMMSMDDEHIVSYFEVATDVPYREVREIERELADGLNPMVAKKRLAGEITRLYHGPDGADEGRRYFEDLHQGKGTLADEDWPEHLLAAGGPRQVGQLFKDAGLVDSTSDARRTIEQGGLEIDGERVTDFKLMVTPHEGMKLRRGKNRLARLRMP